jgi:SPP1 family predicted phage head-tail adaptor
MRAGPLDRRITIQRKTVSPSSSGQPTETWSTLASRWASVAPVVGTERFALPQISATEQTKFQVRWTSDIFDLSPLDRIVYPVGSTDEGQIYDIAAVHEFHRREGLIIIAIRRPDVAAVTAAPQAGRAWGDAWADNWGDAWGAAA